jgi:SAM-dependent methyltransferase
MSRWWADAKGRRWRRAMERQLRFQERKAAAEQGDASTRTAALQRRSRIVAERFDRAGVSIDGARTLEVGSGGAGILSYLPGAGLRISLDPLAVPYRSFYPTHRHLTACAALGEALPFADASFDIVLCDNVIDHARDPIGIVREIVRVLRPGGHLFFTVNLHHWIYEVVSRAHGAWNSVGLKVEIGPFADHTVHLSPRVLRAALATLPLRVVTEEDRATDALATARRIPLRHAGDVFKRLFYKNARYRALFQRS